MRKDVANLLAKLGKREFHYQEFSDRFSDVELWPLFETLIHDPRILQAPPAQDNAEEAVTANAAPHPVAAQPAISAPAAPDSDPVVQELAAPTAKDLSNLFARYGGQNAEDAPADVHALLQKLAQQIEQGKL
jgi:hypothetical protein